MATSSINENGVIESTLNGFNFMSNKKPSSPIVLLSELFYNIVDFFIFIFASIGFILQDLYYNIRGFPEKDIKDDIALITGGGGGIGRLLAKQLCQLGTKIVIWDINKEGINETVKAVEELGGFCKGFVVDISKKEEVYQAAGVLRKEVGDVTILVNNAGVVSGQLLLDTPDYLIERSFNVNIMAHFWTTKAFLPQMIAKDRGHIVTIASLAGHVGISKLVDYCSSKFAAVGFDEALRLELEVLGHPGVQTTCICPFFIQATGMFDDVSSRWLPTLRPEDVAGRIVKAIKTSEKIAMIPGYVRLLVPLKWMFPWGCISGLLRRIVVDAAPNTNPKKKISQPPHEIKMCKNDEISDKTKGTSLLIHRTQSGERVL